LSASIPLAEGPHLARHDPFDRHDEVVRGHRLERCALLPHPLLVAERDQLALGGQKDVLESGLVHERHLSSPSERARTRRRKKENLEALFV
jgi:hypothetical protein